jgi:hypothetical protein
MKTTKQIKATKHLSAADRRWEKETLALDKKRHAEDKKRLQKENEELDASIATYPLPDGLHKSDIHRKWMVYENRPKHAYLVEGEYQSLEFWYVAAFGWCIPTLSINKNNYHTLRTGSYRTYAVTMKGAQVRIGFGPHVLAKHTIDVSVNNVSRLREKFLALLQSGQVGANETRDRISTRRANSKAYRLFF